MYTGASSPEVVQSYVELLEVTRPDYVKPFQDRLRAAPEAASAEALVYAWLRHQRKHPEIADLPGVGGPDFLCSPPSEPAFVVEVASLDPAAASARSGWPAELAERVGSFSMITPSLWSKAKSKAAQLAGANCARVLAIHLAHTASPILLGSMAARLLMQSEPTIVVPLANDAGEAAPPFERTELKNAAFVRRQGADIVSIRRSISAILLFAASARQYDVVGLLHPDPVVAFDYRTFADMPFLRLQWPVQGQTLVSEWVVADPKPAVDLFTPVTLTDRELRGTA